MVEQGGTIRVVHRGRKLARPYLDIRGRVQAGGERGLLSMAFAPNYRENRRFYVYYTDNEGDIRVVEFKGRRNRARKRSARTVLVQDHSTYGNHNGGQLQFGPDGFLYIGTGDGGGGGDPFRVGQDLGTHLGKILRIRPHGKPRIPRSNPFRGRRGARPAVYSYGLRNPWRFSFDRQTGDLVIADVGQNECEEVNFVRSGSGRNFGWSVFEGNARVRRRLGPRPRPAGDRALPRLAASARSPAATSSGTAPTASCAAPTSTATCARASCAARGSRRAGRRAGGGSASRCRACRRSARTRAGASTPRRSTARSTGWRGSG